MSGLPDKGASAGKKAEDPNFGHAREAQKYFDNYAPVLIFGILGLAVQSTTWQHNAGDKVGIAAFVLLLASGLASLWRLERLPKFYVNAAALNEATATRNYLTRMIAAGQKDEGYKKWLKTVGEQLGTFGDTEAREQLLSKRVYWIQKWSFVLGMALLLLARIWPSFSHSACTQAARLHR